MTRGRTQYPVTKLTSPEVGKWVTVNVNGNAHHEARIHISPYSMRKFENLLSHLTEKLKPQFGAVWHLFTENGCEIKDLEEIKGGLTYVASGRTKPAVFPVRMGIKGSRSGSSRRDRELPQLPQLRSHSAVGSLGGHHSSFRGARGPRGGPGTGGPASDLVLDTSSDTNVKHQPCSPSARPRAAPSRPAPAPRKTRTRTGEQGGQTGQMWDKSLHHQQQSHYQRRQSTGKTHAEKCESDEVVDKFDGISFKTHARSSSHCNSKTSESRHCVSQA